MRIKTILLFAVLTATSLSIWGQCKLSPYTQQFVETVRKENISDVQRLKSAYYFKQDDNKGKIIISAFIHLYDGYDSDILRKFGVNIRTILGNILTADIPLEKLDNIVALDGVKYIEMGAPIRKNLDKAREETRVTDIQKGMSLPEEYRGKDVVIGVVDNGFEFGHPNFYSRDKSVLRIKRVWDQNIQGTPPEGFGYGCEYTTTEDILTKVTDTSNSTHGTHVLGIAAGADNTDDKNVYGVATDAEIVLVSLNGNELINSDNTAVLDGVKYIFDYAKSVNKPCVVNLSLGSHLGPRDGSSTFDLLTSEMLGPGRILVGAAGNDGGSKCHVKKTFNGEKTDTLATFLDFKYTYPQSGTVEIWCDKDMAIKFIPFVYRANNNTIKKVYEPAIFNIKQCDNRSYNFTIDNDSISGNLSVTGEINPINGKTHLMLNFNYLNTPNYYHGLYIISSNKGDINMWTENIYSQFSNYGLKGFVDGNDDMTVGEIGGTGKRILSAGAYVTCDYWLQFGVPHYIDEKVNRLASFSSHGPTADGRIKPDITAPGTFIKSSLSNYYTGDKTTYCTINWNGNKYEYGYMQGTSMASPFITGVVATWLQAYPYLTPEDALKIMQKTSRHDSYTGEEIPTNNWGYGKIDAYEGIKECIQQASEIKPTVINNPHMIIFNGKQIKVVPGFYDTNICMQLYNLQGICVAKHTISDINAGEEIVFDKDCIHNGVYIFKISGEKTKSIIRKIIIQ